MPDSKQLSYLNKGFNVLGSGQSPVMGSVGLPTASGATAKNSGNWPGSIYLAASPQRLILTARYSVRDWKSPSRSKALKEIEGLSGLGRSIPLRQLVPRQRFMPIMLRHLIVS